MSASSWPLLQLFDFAPIRDPYYRSLDALYSDPTLLAIAATSAYLVLAVHDVYLKLVHPSSHLQHAYFAAVDDGYSVTHLLPVPASDLVLVVAEKPAHPSLLKVFDLAKCAALSLSSSSSVSTIKHHYLTQTHVSYKDNAFPISCVLANPTISCIALGYTDGKVILVRGDLLHDRGSKQRLVYQSVHPITGIHYHPLHDLFYVVTTSEICTIPTTGRNSGVPATVLAPDAAIDLNCLAIDPFSHELIVADENTIRRYNHSAMTTSFPFPCQKSRIFRLPQKDYLLVVSSVEETNPANGRNKLVSTVSILDTRNAIVAFNLILPNIRVLHVFQMMNDCAFLSNDGILHKLTEKPDRDQLRLIVERDLFPVALDVAKQQHQPPLESLRIMRAYGDHLYLKQNYDESILVFIRCLDLFALVNDPSELQDFVLVIITHYKDVSNIANLAKFLRRLYELNAATNDHITLLFCCYCKLKLTAELDSFIDDIDVAANNSANHSAWHDLNFLLVINLFQECGYSAQMIRLLKKLDQHSLIVGIQLEDLHVPDDALALAASLAIDDLLTVLLAHSKLLLDARPIETTQLLINVFTGKYLPRPANTAHSTATETAPTLVHTSNTARSTGPASESRFPLHSYKAFVDYLSTSSRHPMPTSTPHQPTYMPPRPAIVFASFIGHQYELVVFIEACLHAYQQLAVTIDVASLAETLLEQYLLLRQQCLRADDLEAAQEWALKAHDLLGRYASTMDTARLMLLAHLYRFPVEPANGAADPQQCVPKFMALQVAGNVDACLALVATAGKECPQLYRLMLSMAASSRDTFDKIGEPGIVSLLDHIYSHKLMTPLEVLDILCKHQTGDDDHVPVRVVKGFLLKFFDAHDREISNNTKLVAHYERESARASHQLSQLLSAPMALDQKSCSECNAALTFPIAHFKCLHSYHQRCLDAKSIVFRSLDKMDPAHKHCPQCANEVDDAMRIQTDLTLARLQEFSAFQARLNESADRFKYMCDLLGKGLMDEQPILVMLD